MSYEIKKGIKAPIGKPLRRISLDDLVKLADQMDVGDAVELTLSESQQFRIILAAKGFMCVTDGYRSDDRRKILAFKLAKEAV